MYFDFYINVSRVFAQQTRHHKQMMWNSFIERICEIWRSGTMRRKYFSCCLFFRLLFFFWRLCSYQLTCADGCIFHSSSSHSHSSSSSLFHLHLVTHPHFCVVLIYFHAFQIYVFFVVCCSMLACFCWFCLHKNHQIDASVPNFFSVSDWFFVAFMLCRLYLSRFYFHKSILQMMTLFFTLTRFICIFYSHKWIHFEILVHRDHSFVVAFIAVSLVLPFLATDFYEFNWIYTISWLKIKSLFIYILYRK